MSAATRRIPRSVRAAWPTWLAAARCVIMLKALFRQPGSWLWLALAVYALDYLTKVWASENLVYGWSREILPFMNWTLAHNTGAAFSMLSEAGGWQRWFFVGLALVVSIGLLIWLFRLPATARW